MLQDQNLVVNTYIKKAIKAKCSNKFLKHFINKITKLDSFVCVLLTNLLKSCHNNNIFFTNNNFLFQFT